jgi:serine/threonine protein phosphatase PrpC
MRKENSSFQTAFVSYEGSKLFNNDYYGAAELGKYACYVAADDLRAGDVESPGARVAVQAAIAAFHEHPSIGKKALRRYVRAAHRALLDNPGHLSLRASIAVVITDYETARCAWVGNTRFYLYRLGRLLYETKDHSLSREMAAQGELPLDQIARHEERNNLTSYLGKPGILYPELTKRLKLQDGDIFTLLTCGVWERCDAGDIRSAFDSAENDPQRAIVGIERLMLDLNPQDIDNYTVAVVFADKLYVDPNKHEFYIILY